MSLSIIGNPKHSRIDGGKVVKGAFAWSTTDATGELSAGGLVVIESISFTTVIGTSGGQDPQDFIEVAEALQTDGTLHVPASGTISLERAASGFSGAKVLYRIEGY